MEVLGPYWLRRILAHVGTITVYEGQDTRTGMPVMVLKGAQGSPVAMEGVLSLLEATPEAWILEWPLGAVPLSQYLGVADPSRLELWLKEMARLLQALKAQGVAYAPLPELCLVKGKRVWLGGVGLAPLSGEPEKALAGLARALAGERWPDFSLKEVVEGVERGEVPLEALFAPPPPQEEKPPPPEPPSLPAPSRKQLSVEPVPEPQEVPGPAPEKIPSRPRVIRIEEREEPPFPVVEPPSPRRRRGVGLGLLALLLLLGLGLFLLRPLPAPQEGHVMEFRTDPPTEKAEVVLLEAPEGSRMLPGTLLLTAPGRVEFDRPGVYRLRIRVAGRDPVDYLLEVPGPPLTIKVR